MNQRNLLKCLLITFLSQLSLTSQYSIASTQEPDKLDALLYMFGGGNPKETQEGYQIVDGDVVVPLLRDETNDILAGRKAITDSVLYWPSGEIPYTFHHSVSDVERKAILTGMNHWENETCIRFREATAKDYFLIRFRTDQPGCWSLVGRQYSRFQKGQDVSIGKGCAQWTTVAHEIGHVIGFFHEQSRSDRDKAIHINWENVEKGFYLQFQKEEDENFGVPYDYTSVMQYPSWAFSKDVLNKNTIVTMDPKYQRILGINRGLTFRDKKMVNHLYSCDRDCHNLSEYQCLNGGYLKPGKAGENCTCECPPNTNGSSCQNVITSDYYEPLFPLPCGGNVTLPGYISTPGYPGRRNPHESCVWDIQAPLGIRVELEILDFDFAPRSKSLNKRLFGKCVNESVEIRVKDDYHGEIYCGTDLEPGNKLISEKNRLLIMINADNSMTGKGFKANVRFIGKNGENSIIPSTTYPPIKATSNPPFIPEPKNTTPKPFSTTTIVPKVNKINEITFKPKDIEEIWNRIKSIQQGKIVKVIKPKVGPKI
ncbi:protein SpAN [Tetranychus urticae]|uniref:Metalloendopeptidase n=1 Tax=Tetranychus urticae TaxID=32264 RepID=T1K3F1_TETUR|nr:protein SpAN [Tetranychus urticae]